MKRKLLFVVAGVVLFLMSNVSVGQIAPALGATSGFALFTASGAFDNTGVSNVTGDIGSNTYTPTGFPIPGTIVGTIHAADATTAIAATNVVTAYSDLNQTGIVIAVELGGQTLTPGVYNTGAASTLNGVLTLDGGGNPNALFIIRIGGAFIENAFSNVNLINSASLCNVYWQINGQFDLADNSVFRGTAIVNGAIRLFGSSSLFGRALSKVGAISLVANKVINVMQPIASVITAGGPTTFCDGGDVVLSGNAGGIWSTGATTPTITVTTVGDYYVTNTNECGDITSNHIIVTVNPQPITSLIYHQ